MSYDPERVRSVVDRAVERHAPDAEPVFYAVGGSHACGYAGDDSDVDVRGVHLADGRRYMLVDKPTERVRINQGSTTRGFEAFEDVELVSFELRTFGERLLEANFNVVEFVLGGEVLVDDDRIEDLRAILDEELPLDVPDSYWGLAKSVYEGSLVPGREGYDPTAKNYLYAARALVAADHLTRTGELVVDAPTLVDRALDGEDAATMHALVDAKCGRRPFDDRLRDRSADLVEDLFDRARTPEDVDKSDYRRRIDGWMRSIREAEGQWV